jgi:hypothetical protein
MHSQLELYSISKLEKGRIREKQADPRNIANFTELDAIVAHSLKPARQIQVQTPSGTRLSEPRLVKRPFQDEELLKKLIQFRDQIPPSSRIIRPESS